LICMIGYAESGKNTKIRVKIQIGTLIGDYLLENKTMGKWIYGWLSDRLDEIM
jgi:hypothetical protein